MFKKVLYAKDRKFYWKEGDLHTQFGLVKEEDIKTKTKTKSNKEIEFSITNPNITDLIEKIKRGPQVMLAKDIGFIIAKAGINKDSKVLEIGTGSGKTTIFLALMAKHVSSYEIREDHFRLAQKNLKEFNFKNIKLINKDASKGIREKNFDAAVIDVQEPWTLINNVEKSLKPGSYIVSYCPSIPQISELKDSLKDSKLISITELIQRDWDFQDKAIHPKFKILGHTGFLVLLRKI